MSMAADMAKGKKGDGSRKHARSLFQDMNQGDMKIVKLDRGLATMMHQGEAKQKKPSGKLMPGKCAKSVGRAMGQGGK